MSDNLTPPEEHELRTRIKELEAQNLELRLRLRFSRDLASALRVSVPNLKTGFYWDRPKTFVAYHTKDGLVDYDFYPSKGRTELRLVRPLSRRVSYDPERFTKENMEVAMNTPLPPRLRLYRFDKAECCHTTQVELLHYQEDFDQ